MDACGKLQTVRIMVGRWNKTKKMFRDNLLFFGILAGVIVGCIVGISCHSSIHSSTDPSPKRLAMYVKFPGELFIRMLKMIVIPLITSSIIVALADLSISSAGRLSKITMLYYLTSTIVSATLGLILGIVVKPGSGVYGNSESTFQDEFHNSIDSILDLLRYDKGALICTFLLSVDTARPAKK